MTAAGLGIDVLSGDTAAPATEAEALYGGPLRFDGRVPHVVANFVSTIDGAVSLGLDDGTDASTVGGHHPADRYVMGMLRAAAGAIVIGSGTLRASAGHQWIPGAVSRQHAGLFSEYRRALGLPEGSAPLVVVSGSGRPPAHVALSSPATRTLIATTAEGAASARAAFPRLEVIVAGEGGSIAGDALVAAVRSRLAADVILCEGGPTLFGTLLAAGVAGELFLTVAPWLAGRDLTHPRPGLVEGFIASPGHLPAAVLVSARRSGDHLLLRYRLSR